MAIIHQEILRLQKAFILTILMFLIYLSLYDEFAKALKLRQLE